MIKELRMVKKILFLTLFISYVWGEVDFRTATLYKADITANKAYELQKQGTLLIDTRTISEYKELHPKGSINIPVFYEKKGQRVFNQNFLYEVYNALNKNLDKEVILICRSGSRTKLASNLLAHNKFNNVYNVKEGFAYDWVKEKLPVEK